MSNSEILDKWYNPYIKSIYGFMYGEPYLTGKQKDKIIEIEKKDCSLSEDEDSLIFIWGWPGPDYNIYYFGDYGRTWAFSEEEING